MLVPLPSIRSGGVSFPTVHQGTITRTRIVRVEQPTMGRRNLRVGWALVASGFTMLALLAGFVVLYTNLPVGYDAPYGLSLDSPPLFRTLWPYPILPLAPEVFTWPAGVVLVLLWSVYLLAAALVRRVHTRDRRLVIGIIVTFGLLANGFLALALPPVLSSDVYSYGLYGRMVAVYHRNPYVATDTLLSDDPLWPFIAWRGVPTRYGPAWTLISILPSAVTGESALLTVLALKIVATLFNLVNGLLVFLLARRLGDDDGVRALLLYTWNPLILIETAGSGHNDAVMVTFVLLGLLLVVRGRPVAGITAMTLSVLVKYVKVFLLIFVVARTLHRARTRRQAALLLLRIGAVVAIVGALPYLPFVLTSPGLPHFLTAATPFTNAVQNPLHSALEEVTVSLLAMGGERQWAERVGPTYLAGVLHLGLGMLVALQAKSITAAGLAWSAIVERWGIISLVYVVLVHGGNLPWYLITPLTATMIIPSNRRLQAIETGFGISWILLYAVLRLA